VLRQQSPNYKCKGCESERTQCGAGRIQRDSLTPTYGHLDAGTGFLLLLMLFDQRGACRENRGEGQK